MTDLQLYRQLNEMGQNAYAKWQEEGSLGDFVLTSKWNGIDIEYNIDDDGNMVIKHRGGSSIWLNHPAHDMIFDKLNNTVIGDDTASNRLRRVFYKYRILCNELKSIAWDLIHYNNEMPFIPQKLDIFLTACEEYLEKGTYTLNFRTKERKPEDFCFC